MNEIRKILELREKIEYYNYLYYKKNISEIFDEEYDWLIRKLELLEKRHPKIDSSNSPTQIVGSDV